MILLIEIVVDLCVRKNIIILQCRLRSIRDDEGDGGLISIGTDSFLCADDGGGGCRSDDKDEEDEDDVVLAMCSNSLDSATISSVSHCCKSSASSVFIHSVIHPLQFITMLLHIAAVTLSNASSVCDRASVTLRPSVAFFPTLFFTYPHSNSIGCT